MTENEIKKWLYKQNPVARLTYIRKGAAYYQALIETEITPIGVAGEWVNFKIPVTDMGDADFLSTMDSKHLIRWILKEEEQPT